MLRFLRVQHLAIIDELEMSFDDGFNVLTGETGAGKSILVEAVGLLLGGRASGEFVRTGEDTAIVEAIFESSGTEVVVRREVTAQGRSRAFIDGVLATAGALKTLSAQLVELHGQHDHQVLLDPRLHLEVLDSFGNLGEIQQTVATRFDSLQQIRQDLERVGHLESQKSARLDSLTFQLEEINRIAPRPGEDEELAVTREVLSNAEKLERLCAESYATLYESDQAVLAGLTGIWRRIGELACLEPRFGPYLEARDGIKSQLEDLAFFLRSYGRGIDASPDRLQQVEDRLAALERLKRKYGPTLSDVIQKRIQLDRERIDLEAAASRVADLQRQSASAREAFLESARGLSRARKAAAQTLQRSLEKLLAELAMERTRFEVQFGKGDLPEHAWSERGIDEAEFYVSPNQGEELRPLARIISGGELSRIMLAIRTFAATGGGDRAAGPDKTLVFDEVDAGIGGRVADVVGQKLQELSGRFQVLCITHLPQIAAYGTTHFHVAKSVEGARTITRVLRLGRVARTQELARMMGGKEISDKLRASAREMLEARAGESEKMPKAKPRIARD
jgi:DNA repair protein RecN (Recombination protein N)